MPIRQKKIWFIIFILLLLKIFFTIYIHPGFSGKVIDNVTGEPISNAEVICWWVGSPIERFAEFLDLNTYTICKVKTKTNKSGEFKLPPFVKISFHIIPMPHRVEENELSITADGYLKSQDWSEYHDHLIKGYYLARLHPMKYLTGRIVWRQDIGKNSRDDLKESDLANERYIVATAGEHNSSLANKIFFIDSQNGNVIWSKDIEGSYVYLADFTGDSIKDVLLNIYKGHLLCLINGEDGSELWRKKLDVKITDNYFMFGAGYVLPIGFKDLNLDGIPEIIFADSLERMYVVNSRDGSLVWENLAIEGSKENKGSLGFAFGDLNNDGIIDILVLKENQTKFVALSGKDGTILWEKKIYEKQMGKYETWIDSGPILGDLNLDGVKDIVFFSNANQFYAVNGKDGNIIWNRDYPAHSLYDIFRLADMNGDKIEDVVSFNTEGEITIMDGSNGKVILSRKISKVPLDFFRPAQLIALKDITNDGIPDIIAYFSISGIYALDGKNLELIWLYQNSNNLGRFIIDGTSLNSLLFSELKNNNIYILDLQSGNILAGWHPPRRWSSKIIPLNKVTKIIYCDFGEDSLYLVDMFREIKPGQEK